jgi:uncharacterized membrane protein YukC
MPKKRKNSKIIIIGIIVLAFVCAGTVTYFLYSHFHRAPNQMRFVRGYGNFTFNNETLSQTITFLNSNTNLQAMESYCQQSMNMIYCRFYCVGINPDNQICSQLPTSPYQRNLTGRLSQ